MVARGLAYQAISGSEPADNSWQQPIPTLHQGQTMPDNAPESEMAEVGWGYWRLSKKLEKILGVQEGTKAYADVALQHAVSQLRQVRSRANSDPPPTVSDSREQDMRVLVLPDPTPETQLRLEQERAWAQAVLHWKAETAKFATATQEGQIKHERARSR